MFTFQAIHNDGLQDLHEDSDVKELLSMSTFQAIHNGTEKLYVNGVMSKSYNQCLLFKQFTTGLAIGSRNA